ncbi:hypothetical protein J6590_019819 [Homalodisca vitripennis]|nr:hypothetical protein J6590_019819 [Homalodisca vitripennis]
MKGHCTLPNPRGIIPEAVSLELNDIRDLCELVNSLLREDPPRDQRRAAKSSKSVEYKTAEAGRDQSIISSKEIITLDGAKDNRRRVKYGSPWKVIIKVSAIFQGLTGKLAVLPGGCTTRQHRTALPCRCADSNGMFVYRCHTTFCSSLELNRARRHVIISLLEQQNRENLSRTTNTISYNRISEGTIDEYRILDKRQLLRQTAVCGWKLHYRSNNTVLCEATVFLFKKIAAVQAELYFMSRDQ